MDLCFCITFLLLSAFLEDRARRLNRALNAARRWWAGRGSGLSACRTIDWIVSAAGPRGNTAPGMQQQGQAGRRDQENTQGPRRGSWQLKHIYFWGLAHCSVYTCNGVTNIGHILHTPGFKEIHVFTPGTTFSLAFYYMHNTFGWLGYPEEL